MLDESDGDNRETPRRSGLSWALLGSPGLAWDLLGSPGLSWALLGSFGLHWARMDSSMVNVVIL